MERRLSGSIRLADWSTTTRACATCRSMRASSATSCRRTASPSVTPTRPGPGRLRLHPHTRADHAAEPRRTVASDVPQDEAAAAQLLSSGQASPAIWTSKARRLSRLSWRMPMSPASSSRTTAISRARPPLASWKSARESSWKWRTPTRFSTLRSDVSHLHLRGVSVYPLLRRPAETPLIDMWMPRRMSSSASPARWRRRSSTCNTFSGSM